MYKNRSSKLYWIEEKVNTLSLPCHVTQRANGQVCACFSFPFRLCQYSFARMYEVCDCECVERRQRERHVERVLSAWLFLENTQTYERQINRFRSRQCRRNRRNRNSWLSPLRFVRGLNYYLPILFIYYYLTLNPCMRCRYAMETASIRSTPNDTKVKFDVCELLKWLFLTQCVLFIIFHVWINSVSRRMNAFFGIMWSMSWCLGRKHTWEPVSKANKLSTLISLCIICTLSLHMPKYRTHYEPHGKPSYTIYRIACTDYIRSFACCV